MTGTLNLRTYQPQPVHFAPLPRSVPPDVRSGPFIALSHRRCGRGDRAPARRRTSLRFMSRYSPHWSSCNEPGNVRCRRTSRSGASRAAAARASTARRGKPRSPRSSASCALDDTVRAADVDGLAAGSSADDAEADLAVTDRRQVALRGHAGRQAIREEYERVKKAVIGIERRDFERDPVTARASGPSSAFSAACR